MLSKRYKQEVSATLLGLLRYFSFNNAPMLSALRRLREKKILSLSEKVALETGFYYTFRNILENTTLIKDPAVKANKIVSGVFEYSRVIFMSLLELITRVLPYTPVIKAIELGEVYKELDFVCSYSMKQIENPIEVRTDDGSIKALK